MIKGSMNFETLEPEDKKKRNKFMSPHSFPDNSEESLSELDSILAWTLNWPTSKNPLGSTVTSENQRAAIPGILEKRNKTNRTLNIFFVSSESDALESSRAEQARRTIYTYERSKNGKFASFYSVYFVEQSFRYREVEEVNNFLRDVDISNLTEWSMVALLRASFSARAEIPFWPEFLEKVQEALEIRGKNTNQLLRGLTR